MALNTGPGSAVSAQNTPNFCILFLKEEHLKQKLILHSPSDADLRSFTWDSSIFLHFFARIFFLVWVVSVVFGFFWGGVVWVFLVREDKQGAEGENVLQSIAGNCWLCGNFGLSSTKNRPQICSLTAMRK